MRLYVRCPIGNQCKILLQYANFHLDFAELSTDKINLYSIWLEPLNDVDFFDETNNRRYIINAQDDEILSSSEMINNFENCFGSDQKCLKRICNYFEQKSKCLCSQMPSKWRLALYGQGTEKIEKIKLVHSSYEGI